MDKKFSFDVLTDGSLILTVGESCIRTVAASAHRELSRALLDDGASDKAAEIALDTLAQFLNTFDFARLRATFPKLAGGSPSRVRVYRASDKTVKWAFEKSSPSSQKQFIEF